MPVQLRPAQVDFGMLAKLPELFYQGQDRARQNALRNIPAFNADGSPNYQAIWASDPEMAAKLYAADSLAGYRTGMLGIGQQKAIPDDLQILQWWQKQQEPSRLGPSDPIAAGVDQADAEAAGKIPVTSSGVPGMSIQNAPAAVQKVVAPLQLQKQLEAEGTAEGQRQGVLQGTREISPAVQGLVNRLAEVANSADTNTFENALGPLQGGPDAETWSGALQQGTAQTAGALANYLDQGSKVGFVDWKTGHIKEPGELPGGFTSTLRAKINSTSASLINIFQRYLRVQGIGSQSDKELQQLVDQAGNLTKSRTQADFNDRLANIVDNMKSLGFQIELPQVAQIVPGKTTDRFVNPNEGPMQGNMAPAPSAIPVPTYNVSPTGEMSPTSDQLNISEVPGAVNGPVKQGPGAAPPMPRPDRVARFRQWMKVHPDDEAAKAFWERTYGPGSVDFYLQKGR